MSRGGAGKSSEGLNDSLSDDFRRVTMTKMEREIFLRIIPLIEEYPEGISPTSWGYDPNSNEGVDSIEEVLWKGNLKPEPALALALIVLDYQGHLEDALYAAYYIIDCIERLEGMKGAYKQLLSSNKEQLLSILRSCCE
jgi:hypothetical protein